MTPAFFLMTSATFLMTSAFFLMTSTDAEGHLPDTYRPLSLQKNATQSHKC